MPSLIKNMSFGVVYFDKEGKAFKVEVIKAADYWGACNVALKKKRAADFQLTDDPKAILEGPSGIMRVAGEISIKLKRSPREKTLSA